MANKVLLKKSSVSGKIPQTTDLDYGEIALNYTDGIIYYKNNENLIRTFGDDYNRSLDLFITTDNFVGNGSGVSFILSTTPKSDEYVLVSIDGVIQSTSEYSLSGNTLTFTTAPALGVSIEIRTLKGAGGEVELRDYQKYIYSINTTTSIITGLDSNGYTLEYDSDAVDVYVNGIRMVQGIEYTTTDSSTITLAVAAENGDTVEILSYGKAYIADFPNIGTAANEIPLNQYLGALAYVDSISAGTGLTQETSGLSLTSITAGDDIVGAIKYNGTTKTAGQMYGGSSTPTNTTRLNYDGHLYATEMYAVNFDSTSDQRAKTNIVTIDNALEKTLKLRGVEFDWKESGQHAIGVIAQEVEQIIPEVVNDNGELKSVSYGNIVGLLIEAIKEQQKQIEELQNKIK